MPQKPIVLHTDSVNKYGYRAINSGADLSGFEANPVMLYMHQRYSFPIGTWEDIHWEGNKLVATPKFDENDEFAQIVKQKYEDGVINAASVWYDVYTVSSSPEHILEGQTRPTLTSWGINEGSLVDIPGNKEAVKLSFSGNALKLSGDGVDLNELDKVLPKLNSQANKDVPEKPKPKAKMDLKNINAALSLDSASTEGAVLSAITQLKAQATKNEGIEKAFQRLALAQAEEKGLVNDTNKASFEKLLKADPEATLSMIEAAPAKEEKKPEPEAPAQKPASLSDALKTAAPNVSQDTVDKESFAYLEQNDPEKLAAIRTNEPEKYAKLLADYNSTFKA